MIGLTPAELAEVHDKRRLIAENAALRERIEAELHHAEDNEHRLDRDCQGVGPGEIVPAVRISNVRAALAPEGNAVSEGAE